MKKKTYTLPLVDLVAFEGEDILTLSVGLEGKAIGFDFEDFFKV